MNKEKFAAFPEWIDKCFEEFESELERTMELFRLAIIGLSLVTHRPNAIRVLHDVQEPSQLDAENNVEISKKQRLIEAENDERLAKKEIESGYFHFVSQATVTLWNSLEAHVRKLVAFNFLNEDSAWQAEAVSKLKVKLGEYSALDHNERSFWVVDLLDQELSGPQKAGINRFEVLLQVIGVSGDIEEEVKKKLFELSAVRHLLVHRSGIVDRKFNKQCPWMEQATGQRIELSARSLAVYHRAVHLYHSEIMLRFCEKYGYPRGKLLSSIKNFGNSDKDV